MNIRSALMALGFMVGAAQAATDPIKAIGSDFDDVITQSTSFPKYVWESGKAIGLKNTAKGLKKIMTDKKAWETVKAAAGKKLYYPDGRKVIGAPNYVELIVQDALPFLTEKEKAKLLEIAWQVKPNVELIEFYQTLQKNGIPVYVWTDNDQAGYDKKLGILNAELVKMGKQPFIPNGFQCAISSTLTDPGLNKEYAQYFKQAYQTLQNEHPELGATPKMLFLDDRMKYVENARNAAKTENINLEAFQYKGKKSDLEQLRAMFA